MLTIVVFAENKNTVKITDDNFKKQVIDHEGIVLVDFWAAWCGPCKKLGPIIEELAEKHKGKIKFTKLNVDNNRKTAAMHREGKGSIEGSSKPIPPFVRSRPTASCGILGKEIICY